MREHGVLNRILLIYDESARRLDAQQQLPIDVLAKSADLIRRFIEQYHEKLEEDFLFPRFEKANRLVDLVATLRRQHQAGRALTDTILRLSTAASVQEENDRRQARSDATVLHAHVPSTRGPRGHGALSGAPQRREPEGVLRSREQFRDKEHDLFGKDGFEGWSCRLERSSRPSVCST